MAQVIQLIDSNTKESVNYEETFVWYDGTPMDDSKVDNVIYRKKENKYYRRCFERFVNIMWFGTKGDGKTDDSKPISQAINYCFRAGKSLYIPKGDFIITSSIQIIATTSFSPICPEIFGDGINSVLIGKNIKGDRAIIELIGISNVRPVVFYMHDLRFKQRDCDIKSMCLIFGDAKNSAVLKRVHFDGNNGVGIKISSSNSYAQINTLFENCVFRSNYDKTVDENKCEMYAVRSISGGAKWDNVKFISCFFAGLVQTRGHIVNFDTCQFTTNPNRPIIGSTYYGANVEVRFGNATFDNCYFEDHYYGVVINPSIGNVDYVTFINSHFSGVSNYRGYNKAAIFINKTNQNNRLGFVTVENCRFGDRRDGVNIYEEGSIVSNIQSFLTVDNCINIFDSSPIRIQYPNGRSSLKINNRSVSQISFDRTEKYVFEGGFINSTISYAKIFNSINYISTNVDFSIHKLILYTNRLLSKGESLSIRLLKNGKIEQTISRASLTEVENSNGIFGYILNLSPNYKGGDKLSIQVNTQEPITGGKLDYKIEIYLSEGI